MAITFPLSFSSDAIKSKGADKLAIRIVNSDGTHNGSNTWVDAFYRSKSTIMLEQPEDDIKGESGNVLTTEPGDVKAEIKITSLQSESNFFNFLNVDTQNQYFSIFIDCGSDKNNTRQFCYIPVAKIQRGFNYSQPGGETEVTIKPLFNPTSFNGNSLSAANASVTGWTGFNASLSSSITGDAGSYLCFRSV